MVLISDDTETPDVPVEEGWNDNVWTGSQSLNAWGDTFTLPAEKFAALTADSEFSINFQVADRNNAQGQLGVKFEGTDYYHMVSGNDYIDINSDDITSTDLIGDNVWQSKAGATLSAADALAAIKASGISVGGHDFKLVKIEINIKAIEVPVEGWNDNVWTGSQSLNEWGDTFTLPAEKFAQLASDSEFSLNFQVSDRNEAQGQLGIKIDGTEYYHLVSGNDYIDISSDDITSTDLLSNNNWKSKENDYPTSTAQIVEAIKANGILVGGHGFKLVKAVINIAGGTETPDDPDAFMVSLASDVDLQDWSYEHSIPASFFSQMSNYDVITFEMTPNSTNELQLQVNTGKWTNIYEYLDNVTANHEITFSAGSAEQVAQKVIRRAQVQSDYVNEIKESGLVIKGKGTVKKATLHLVGMETGVKEINLEEMINFSEPVEYYNLQGARVANPEHGVFIVRQGQKVMKIAK